MEIDVAKLNADLSHIFQLWFSYSHKCDLFNNEFVIIHIVKIFFSISGWLNVVHVDLLSYVVVLVVNWSVYSAISLE